MAEAILVTPLDIHNQKLVDNVHPAAWINPTPASVYHLVVLGAGTAGLVSAAATAGLGGKVALVEKHLLGGDCLNYGCVPSKAVLRAARAWKEAARLKEFGLEAEIGRRDFGAVMVRMRELRAKISANDSVARFRDLGVDVFLGKGRFVAADAVEVDGSQLRFHRAVVATGARPSVPPVKGLVEIGYLTNETVFSLTSLPQRLAVIGGGPIGCELAQAFARFGSQVTVLLREHHLLPREELAAASVVQEALEADGVRVVGKARLLEITRMARSKGVHFEVDGQRHQLPVDEILLAAGRVPNVEDLGLEAAGIALDARGVQVDDRLRTTNPRVYACGDVCSRYQFTHAADATARLVVQNAFFRGSGKASELTIPWCTYTSPELAHVGLSEEQLEEQRIAYETITVELEENDRALLDGEPRGLLRLHHAKGKEKILGATLVSEHAGESIGELVLALRQGIGLSQLSATIHPYPTQAEAIRKAGDLWRRKRLTPFVKRLFAFWFRRLEKRALAAVRKTAAKGS